MDVLTDLEQGRDAYAKRAWLDAYTVLRRADEREPLAAADLELLAISATMIGRVDDFLATLERAHHARLGASEELAAARDAFWLGMTLAVRGEMGPAGGWFGRAERLVDRHGEECVERGFLLVPRAFPLLASGDHEGAYELAAAAAAIAERFGDRDLFSVVTHFQGEIRIKQGRVEEGLRLLDEAMVAVTADEVSPFLTGVVYCGVIACCEEAFEPRRAHEWTNALTRWCESQPQMVSFTGRCLAHRAGIKQMHGEWSDALEEARLARERSEQAANRAATGQALYQQGELHRLQGRFGEAEDAYREASRFGREPQPGLALLRLATGEVGAAAAALRRALDETTEPMQRAVLLPAFAEVALAAGDVAEARRASREISDIAASTARPMLRAIASYVEGAVAVAADDSRSALPALRAASRVWQELDAPYEVARARVLLAVACRAMEDEETAALDLEAARNTFERLGAAPDLARLESLMQPASADRHGLTTRELEVLRLVASGKTNREIARELVVSEHTVARHVQNIFTKLGVSSRTAATAFAFEHGLV